MKRFFQKAFATDPIEYGHVGVLDGIRALSVILVVGFHFWQQSWLWNLYDPSKLRFIGIEDSGMNWIFSTGYVWVDMMILLTGICLFLPHAAKMIYGNTPLSSPPEFYVKRAARIFPSYYFNIAVLLIFFVRPADYGGGAGVFFKDLFSHLTFTHMLSKDTYLYTKFNGVLWTVAVEMLFYLMFPLLAWLFRKAPLLTYIGMNAASLGYYLFVTARHSDDLSFYINRFPSFLCVFANGMLAALVIVSLSKNMAQTKYTGLGFTALAIFGLYLMRLIIKYGLNKAQNGQLWQIQNRFMLTFVFAIFIVGACFSFRWFRVLFSNPAARFFAGISYNLYIWHQLVAIYFKKWKIPYWESAENLPQRDAGLSWQWKYTVIIWLVSIAVAAAATYLIEKPLHKLILAGLKKVKEKRAARSNAAKAKT
ncbi:MAG: acyltransferase [Clostridia bacterium]|nr:acyltransferase [Clostridia bacterium]